MDFSSFFSDFSRSFLFTLATLLPMLCGPGSLSAALTVGATLHELTLSLLIEASAHNAALL